FFQAEDGIRDRNVTGVQTCALPISRILFAISRDGLLPPFFSHIDEKTGSPVRVILLAGLVMASIAAFTPLNEIVELTNIGTLSAFAVVCAGVAVLRYTKPDLHRPFRTPFSPVVPLLGIASCTYLMTHLSEDTWTRFSIWLTVGLIIYFTYSYRHSKLSAPEKSKPAYAPLE